MSTFESPLSEKDLSKDWKFNIHKDLLPLCIFQHTVFSKQQTPVGLNCLIILKEQIPQKVFKGQLKYKLVPGLG